MQVKLKTCLSIIDLFLNTGTLYYIQLAYILLLAGEKEGYYE